MYIRAWCEGAQSRVCPSSCSTTSGIESSHLQSLNRTKLVLKKDGWLKAGRYKIQILTRKKRCIDPEEVLYAGIGILYTKIFPSFYIQISVRKTENVLIAIMFISW